MLIGFDLATRKSGWCAGTGEAVPDVGAILLPQVDADLGMMLDLFDQRVAVLIDRFKPTHFIYEAPILLRSDKLLTVRKLYALGAHLEFMARRAGILCCEESLKALKIELAGRRNADKADMVAAALKVGVKLPDTLADGREDAADAFAAWLIGVRCYARPHSAAWDRRLWSSRSALF